MALPIMFLLMPIWIVGYIITGNNVFVKYMKYLIDKQLDSEKQ